MWTDYVCPQEQVCLRLKILPEDVARARYYYVLAVKDIRTRTGACLVCAKTALDKAIKERSDAPGA